MWISVEKQDPDRNWLRDHGYMEDWIWVWSSKRPSIEPTDNYLHHKDGRYYTHWAPISRPKDEKGHCWCRDCGGDCKTIAVANKPAAKPCHPPVINVTFGDVNIANESDADEFQARVIEAVRKALCA